MFTSVNAVCSQCFKLVNVPSVFFFYVLEFFLFIFYFYFFNCSGFCHTLKWNSHGFTCVPHLRQGLGPGARGRPKCPICFKIKIYLISSSSLFHLLKTLVSLNIIIFLCFETIRPINITINMNFACYIHHPCRLISKICYVICVHNCLRAAIIENWMRLQRHHSDYTFLI